MSATVLLAGCGSAESRAEEEGRREAVDALYAAENSLSVRLRAIAAVADTDDVGSWVPSTYRDSVDGGIVTVEFGVRGVGRDDRTSLGETVVSVGACFRVRGNASAATIRQVRCPRTFLRAFGQTVEVEAELIKGERPLGERG